MTREGARQRLAPGSGLCCASDSPYLETLLVWRSGGHSRDVLLDALHHVRFDRCHDFDDQVVDSPPSLGRSCLSWVGERRGARVSG
jgi:hypothetical protein